MPSVDDLTPWDWVSRLATLVPAMAHWDDVGRVPETHVGAPTGTLDRCDCPTGQVLVEHGTVFFAGERWPERTPVTVREVARGCSALWGVPLTVRYARCRPTVDAQGRSPSPATMYEWAEGLHVDAWAILEALQCATMKDWRGSLVLTGWGPIQAPLGPCGGYEFSLTGKVKQCATCP